MTTSKELNDTELEQIEDEYDLKCLYKAIKEFEKNNKTYTLEEVKNVINKRNRKKITK